MGNDSNAKFEFLDKFEKNGGLKNLAWIHGYKDTTTKVRGHVDVATENYYYGSIT